MLHTTCHRTATALVAVQRRTRFSAAFGRFAQRTIDRRYCGIIAVQPCNLLQNRAGTGLPGAWFPLAVRLAGGRPSVHCWQPFAPAAPAAPTPAARRPRRQGSRQRLHEFSSYFIKRERKESAIGPVFRLAPGQPWPTHTQQVALAQRQTVQRQQRAAQPTTCATCGQGPDYFSHCGCAYETRPSSYYFHA
jgi:hypothetical protein